MDRSVKIKRLQSPSKGRTICISDIHGNLNIYKKLLNKVKYQTGHRPVDAFGRSC